MKKQCVKCGVKGGCKCLFTSTPQGLVCGLCSGKATLERAAEIRHLRKRQGIDSPVISQRGKPEPYVVVNKKRR